MSGSSPFQTDPPGDLPNLSRRHGHYLGQITLPLSLKAAGESAACLNSFLSIKKYVPNLAMLPCPLLPQEKVPFILFNSPSVVSMLSRISIVL